MRVEKWECRVRKKRFSAQIQLCYFKADWRVTTSFQKLTGLSSMLVFVGPRGSPQTSGSRNCTALGAGIFLLTLAAGMVVFTSENFMAWGIGFFAFLVGLALIMMGALDITDKKNKPVLATPRPVVRIRCTHCNSLNLETSLRCSNCGAKLLPLSFSCKIPLKRTPRRSQGLSSVAIEIYCCD